MSVDVDRFKCVFLKNIVDHTRAVKYGGPCCFPDLLKTFSAYIFMLDSGCALSEDLERAIQDFYNENVLNQPYPPYIGDSIQSCLISLGVGGTAAASCPAISISVS